MMRNAFVPLAAAALLTACGDNGPSGPDAAETYSASVSGDLSGSIGGRARFGSDPNNGDPVFAIVLGDATSQHLVVLARSGTARPGKGTYDITNPFESSAADDWTVLHFVGSTGDAVVASFIAVSGTLTITESSSRQLKGSFEYAADGFLGETDSQPVSVSVAGTFDAAMTSTITAGFKSAFRLHFAG